MVSSWAEAEAVKQKNKQNAIVWFMKQTCDKGGLKRLTRYIHCTGPS
jgi:hypothetical protein